MPSETSETSETFNDVVRMEQQNETESNDLSSYSMKLTKQTRLTIRLTEREKEIVKREAKKMNLDASKFLREHFIKLINDDYKI